MRRLSVIVLVLLVQVAFNPFSAPAYEEIVVKNGGGISGKVTLKGPIPSPRVFPLYLFPFGSFCKKISTEEGIILLEEFNVESDGGLQDAVVAVQSVRSGKSFSSMKGEFLATDCMFHPAGMSTRELYEVDAEGHARHLHPLVTVIKNHQPISVINKDPIPHNGQVFQKETGNMLLNFPLPVGDQPRGGVLHFKKGKKIGQMICGMHAFMQTWTLVVDNPYYAKTKSDGEFSIDDLPAGPYEILAWHPRLKPIIKNITVPADGVVSVDFEFDGGQVRQRVYESREGSRTF